MNIDEPGTIEVETKQLPGSLILVYRAVRRVLGLMKFCAAENIRVLLKGAVSKTVIEHALAELELSGILVVAPQIDASLPPVWRLGVDSEPDLSGMWRLPKDVAERLLTSAKSNNLSVLSGEVTKTLEESPAEKPVVSAGDKKLEKAAAEARRLAYRERREKDREEALKPKVKPKDIVLSGEKTPPKAPAGPTMTLSEILADPEKAKQAQFQLEQDMGRNSLRRFVKYGFHVIEPSVEFKDTRHIQIICEHMEAVARGEIKKLAIAIPGRHGKSSTVSVAFLPWIWTWDPSRRAIHASYADKLVVRDSIKARRLIESDWYKERWSAPNKWSLREDQNTQDAFSNTMGGHRLSLSVGGRAIGEGGSIIIADDPQNTDSVYSKTDREKTARWWFETMTTRVEDPNNTAFIVIQQRLHPDDLIGRALARELGYEYLCLPSEFDPGRKFITYKVDKTTGERKFFRSDWRKEKGELLFPEMFNETVLADQKKTLGAAGYAAQHQQDPSDVTNAIFKPAFWRFWRPMHRIVPDGPVEGRPAGCSKDPAVILPEKFDQIVIGVDCTLLGEGSKDFAVAQAWGSVGGDRYLLEAHRGKFGHTHLSNILLDMHTRYPFAAILVEEAVVGPAIVENLSKIPGVKGIRPEGEKISRIVSIVPQLEAGNLFLPDGAGWLDDFVTEFTSFPGSHDDQCDAAAHAIRSFTEGAISAAQMPVIGGHFGLWPNRGNGITGAIALGSSSQYDRASIARRYR